MDSLDTELLIVDGILASRAYLDSLPSNEVITLEVVRGGYASRPVVQLVRCNSRYDSCPWALPPRAER